MFLEPAIQDVLQHVYRCQAFALPITFGGSPVPAYRIERPWKKQFTLAPFNFQPVLRDVSADLARVIVGLARDAGGSARIRLHHRLDPRLETSLGLTRTENLVETLVSLSGGFDAVVARMQPRLRGKWRKICAAADKELAVEIFRDTPALREFHRLLVRTYRDKHHMLAQPLELFRRLLAMAPGPRTAFGYGVRHRERGDLLGGIFILADEGQWCYAWGATLQDAGYSDLSTLLIGIAMRDAAAAGSAVFSLGASPVSHENLRRFKRSWSGEEHPVLSYHWGEPAAEEDLHQGYPLARAMVAHAPLWLLTTLSGPAVKWLA